MPKSKVRKKTDYTINPASRVPVKVKAGPSGVWYLAIMFGLMIVGLAWLVVYYLTIGANGGSPVVSWLQWMADLGSWNFLIGFAAMVVGLLMTMRWR
ncbi:cell division protein CrgA [Gordonia sp. TBRC 11910]|uniref:Cell division protein CrgA n=1 Tax=Gordonia asplenii TaxID=2725283 RepID=A0A848L273_9ACTN|nr:cell division protein CrgA [Gordonia asplenii]NMO02621.1 cell division protein CrgA [Gordonia asplenii]